MKEDSLNAMMLFELAMIKYEISVYFEPKLIISIRETWFKIIIHNILDTLDITTPSELGLVLTDNEVIQQLNNTYREKDEPTDVLAFYMLPQQGTKGAKFVAPPDGISHLGEIVISYPQAVNQAKEKRHSIKRELLILIIHGVLHLLGYDHEQSEEGEQRMRAKEEEILGKLSSRNSKQ